jgi:hypothetical protein
MARLKIYRDISSVPKEDNTKALAAAIGRVFGYGRDVKILVLDGPRLQSSRVLMSKGFKAGNIVVVELEAKTASKQAKAPDGVTVVGPMPVAHFFRICQDSSLPDAVYLDYLTTWYGSELVRPIADIYAYLSRCTTAGKHKVVLAATFTERNNYQRQDGFKEDLLAVLGRFFHGRRLTAPGGSRERAIVDAYLRSCVFPHTGWTVTSGKVRSYKRTKDSPNMMFFCYRLIAARPKASVEWPLIDGRYVGFDGDDKSGEWVTTRVKDLM